jgi:hypothetical protein
MRPIVSATLIATLLATAATSAHHSHPDFLADQEATVEGTIDSIQFENPHVIVKITTADSVLYTIEWQGATWLANEPRVFVTPIPGPVTSDTLRVGDLIVVTGVPPRDPMRHELVNLKALSRPADNWLWTCRRPPGHMC